MSPVVFLAAIIMFIAYCWAWDHVGGASNSFWVLMCRLFAKHVKLALFLTCGFVLGFLSVGAILAEAGSGSTTMIPYGRGPEFIEHRSFIGRVWHWGASLLAPFALLTCVFCSSAWRFYLAHMMVCNWILFGAYLLWLWFTVRSIVHDEFVDNDADVLRSVGVIGTWVVVVLAAAWGFRWLFAGIWARS